MKLQTPALIMGLSAVTGPARGYTRRAERLAPDALARCEAAGAKG